VFTKIPARKMPEMRCPKFAIKSGKKSTVLLTLSLTNQVNLFEIYWHFSTDVLGYQRGGTRRLPIPMFGAGMALLILKAMPGQLAGNRSQGDMLYSGCDSKHMYR
jgi:hypothetical protein